MPTIDAVASAAVASTKAALSHESQSGTARHVIRRETTQCRSNATTALQLGPPR